MKKYVFFSIVCLCLSMACCGWARAQISRQEALRDYDFLVRFVQCNYPGYEAKTAGGKASELQFLTRNLRKRVARSPDSVKWLMQQYTQWFRDAHLHIKSGGNSRSHYAEVSSPTTNPEPISVSDSMLTELKKCQRGLRGYWECLSGEQLIILPHAEEFDLYLYRQGMARWMMRLKPIDGRYASADGAFSCRLMASDCYLDFANTKFDAVRGAADKAEIAGLMGAMALEQQNTSSDNYPMALPLDADVFFLRLPSFADDYANRAVQKHYAEIISRPILLIDLRNNRGGQDENFSALIPLLYDHPYTVKGVEWYATAHNIDLLNQAIRYWQQKGDADRLAWCMALADAMKNRKGEFVLHPLQKAEEEVRCDGILSMPRYVGVIINGRNASSAEEFILSVARNSGKTILFGTESTQGVLDYSNTMEQDFPSGRYVLVYPQTRSLRLPDAPIDGVGIAPDVCIPLPSRYNTYDCLDAEVYYVLYYLKQLLHDDGKRQ